MLDVVRQNYNPVQRRSRAPKATQTVNVEQFWAGAAMNGPHHV